MSPASIPGTALLIFFVVTCIYRTVIDAKEYQDFKKIRSTAERQKMLRKWLIGSFLIFGVGSLLCLLLLGIPITSVGTLPTVFATTLGVKEYMPILDIMIFILIMAIVIAAQTILFIKLKFFPVLGDIDAMLPRNKKEKLYGIGLSINAGLVEELAFCYTLPILLYVSGFSVEASLLIAVVLFGLMHAYQGLIGILATMALGLVLMMLYVFTGSILAPIFLHAFLDIRMFIMGPYVQKKNTQDNKRNKNIQKNKYSKLRAIIGLPLLASP